MIYLTGAWHHSQVDRLAALRSVGAMLTPRNGGLSVLERFPCWAADNGCFASGDKFVLEKFYRWLDRVPRSRCLFATAPDVFPDAPATLRRSLPVLPRLRDLGFKAAFVFQNGADFIPWDEFDAMFIGGTNEWKLGLRVRELVVEARVRNKWVHMGRVNSERRMRYASLIGCHSVDGTGLKFRNRNSHKGVDGVREIGGWFNQGVLPL